MRSIFLLVAGGALASCTYGPPPTPAMQAASAQHAFQTLIAGKVAQQPASCLPNYRADNMTVIDGRTLGFRVGTGAREAYVVRLSAGCEMLGDNLGYTLVSRQPGGMGLCQGDIEQVIQNSTHIPVGSCSIEQIIPYRG